jgi:hypothetical protein
MRKRSWGSELVFFHVILLCHVAVSHQEVGVLSFFFGELCCHLILSDQDVGRMCGNIL